MRGARGFTLLEIIIALGILAVGSTAALALLVAATATGKHAENLVNSALIADTLFTEVEAELNGGFSPKKLERLDTVSNPAPRSSSFVDGPIRAVVPEDPNWTDATAPGSQPPPQQPAPTPPGPGGNNPNGNNVAPRAFDEDPFAKAKTYVWKKDETLASYPDYKFDVTITPIGGPPDDPWEFLVEATVRWSERGQKRDGVYQTILLKKLTHLDNEAPPSGN